MKVFLRQLFVTEGASWYFAQIKMDIPIMGTAMSHEFLFIRGFIHFALFLVTFYVGFIKRIKSSQEKAGIHAITAHNNILKYHNLDIYSNLIFCDF